MLNSSMMDDEISPHCNSLTKYDKPSWASFSSPLYRLLLTSSAFPFAFPAISLAFPLASPATSLILPFASPLNSAALPVAFPSLISRPASFTFSATVAEKELVNKSVHVSFTLQPCKGEHRREGVVGKGGRSLHPMLIPSTSLSLTVRSTPFSPSFTLSAADFWAAKPVVKLRGACVARPRGMAAGRAASLLAMVDDIVWKVSGVVLFECVNIPLFFRIRFSLRLLFRN